MAHETFFVLMLRLVKTSRFMSTASLPQQQQPARGWRKYAQQFRHKPASYLTTFAILHELTAIVPLPLVYYLLDYSEIRVPLVPEQAIAEGNRIMSKLRTRYGYEPLDPSSRVMVNLATSYAVVKVGITKTKRERKRVCKTHIIMDIGHDAFADSSVGGHDAFLCREMRGASRGVSQKAVPQADK